MSGDDVNDDRAVAEKALEAFDLPQGSTLRLLNLSENATYAVEEPGCGHRSILRVHRQDYHRVDQIESELLWLDALRRDSDVTVPTVLPAHDGRRVVTVAHDGADRHVVHFEMVPGAEPDENALTSTDFHTLGRITAALHDHARSWERPAAFSRFAWDWENSLGGSPRWGRWRDAIGVGAQEAEVLERAQRLLHRRLAEYGTGPDTFGLVHADLRLANLLVDGDTITVIDFDDCGFGWYMYDAATPVSFYEHEPQVPGLIESWKTGYRKVLALPKADEDEIPTFIMLRRILLVAWIASHIEAEFPKSLGAGYTDGTLPLCEDYLRKFS